MYGNAHIIAFDMPEEGGFAVVDRQELAFWCEKNVIDEFVTDKRHAYRRKYSRKDREDVITKLNLHDLKCLESYRVWDYETIIEYLQVLSSIFYHPYDYLNL